MISKLFFCFTILCLSSVTLANTACIVGAGPAGLTVAKGLEDRGYTTVLFDKNAQVGGKCQSYYDEQGIFHPMGALFFVNETYQQTLPIIEASGVLSAPFSYDIPMVLYHNDGESLQFPVKFSDLTSQEHFAAEISRYAQVWNQTFAPTMAIGYTNGVGNFTMSTFDWLKANNFPFLLFLFLNAMVPTGYGDVRETPILYTLTYLTPDILRFFAAQLVGNAIDFQKVFVEYAKNIKGEIHLNSTIKNIDRSGSPVITYLTSGSTTPVTQNCDKLVLAFPPLVRALKDANLEVSPAEIATFSPIGITTYWSGAVSMNIPSETAFGGFLSKKYVTLLNTAASGVPVSFDEYESALPDATGEPVTFLRLFGASNVASTWSWGKYRSNQTLEEARDLLKTVLSKVNKFHPHGPPSPIAEADIKEFKQWDYFPHYDQLDLEAGIYAKFNNLQGQQNTFYASGLNGFETVEFAVRAGNDIVERITSSTFPPTGLLFTNSTSSAMDGLWAAYAGVATHIYSYLPYGSS